MSLALDGSYPEGVRPVQRPLRFYTDLDTGPRSQLRASLSILTSGECVGPPVTVYTD